MGKKLQIIIMYFLLFLNIAGNLYCTYEIIYIYEAYADSKFGYHFCLVFSLIISVILLILILKSCSQYFKKIKRFIYFVSILIIVIFLYCQYFLYSFTTILDGVEKIKNTRYVDSNYYIDIIGKTDDYFAVKCTKSQYQVINESNLSFVVLVQNKHNKYYLRELISAD